MKGNSKALISFMDGSDKRFVIPVYQRNYDWKRENCQQLLSDLLSVIAEDRPSHFFGSIVASTEGSDYIIIDGQQRLTTVSLLLLALKNLVENGEIPVEFGRLPEKIGKTYLMDEYSSDERKMKLKPVKNDMDAFDRLFGAPEDFSLSSNITQNYLYFYDAIKKSGVLADDLFEAIKKLVVIDITLEYGDDPQLIFESLNSTGLDLSEADKIRNYILMGLDQTLQEKLYEQYWNKIEEFTCFSVSDFIRQYLTLKQGKWPNINAVYRTFKAYNKSLSADTEDLLRDLLKHARYFRQISEASTGDREIDAVLRRLSLLDVSVVNPFLFAVFERMGEGALSAGDVAAVLSALESYIFRRIVCDVPTNALNKVFATLNGEVMRLIEDDLEYVPALVFALERKAGTSRFPDNAEFDERVRTRDFYGMGSKNKIYCFDRLENGNSYETLNVPAMMVSKEHGLSVEHIMPQTLTETWKRDLGPDWEGVHAKWKNRIANLTLTAYNSKYSNRPFPEKLTMADGFADSPLPLNRWIAQQSKWTAEELEARSEIMAKRFIELWPYPETDFAEKETVGLQFSLDEGNDFTGTKVASFAFMGAKQSAKTWKDVAELVLRQVFELDPAGVYALAASDEFPGSFLTVTQQAPAYGWVNIGKDVYAYLATSTAYKIRVLEAVFEKLGLEGSELVFEIRPDHDAESGQTEETGE